MENGGGEGNVSANMTHCGSPLWAAPEMLRAEEYSEKADVYSFAIVLWEMMARTDPYGGASGFSITIKIAEKVGRGRRGVGPLLITSSHLLSLSLSLALSLAPSLSRSLSLSLSLSLALSRTVSPSSSLFSFLSLQGLRPTIPEYCPKYLANMMEVCWQSNPKHRPPFTRIIQALLEEYEDIFV